MVLSVDQASTVSHITKIQELVARKFISGQIRTSTDVGRPRLCNAFDTHDVDEAFSR